MGVLKEKCEKTKMATTTVNFQTLTRKMVRFHDLALNMFHKYNHMVTQATFYDATHLQNNASYLFLSKFNFLL